MAWTLDAEQISGDMLEPACINSITDKAIGNRLKTNPWFVVTEKYQVTILSKLNMYLILVICTSLASQKTDKAS